MEMISDFSSVRAEETRIFPSKNDASPNSSPGATRRRVCSPPSGEESVIFTEPRRR